MSITRGNADNYELDAMTVSGRKMVIKIRPNGFYYIDVEGAGDKPTICEHNYTSINEVRKARDEYLAVNAADIAKREMIERIAGPKPERTRKLDKSRSE